MLDEERIMSFTFLTYGGEMSGDHYGMRYMLKRVGEKPDFQIEATVWPEPLAYDKASEAIKTTTQFEYSEDGRKAAIQWLWNMYEEKREIWDTAPRL